MLAYKFKNRGIGWQVVKIPANTTYTFAIYSPDYPDSVKLFDGGTEITSRLSAFNLSGYVLFYLPACGEQTTKEYTAVISGDTPQKIHILARFEKSSQTELDPLGYFVPDKWKE